MVHMHSDILLRSLTYGDNKPDSVPELEAQDPFEVVEEEPEDVDIDAM